MVECSAGVGANDVKIILKLGLNDRHICPYAYVLKGYAVDYDPSSFGTVPGDLRVEDLLNYTSWVEILDVNLKEGEKPVQGKHWTDSLDPLFVSRSLVLADGTVAGYMASLDHQRTTRIVNGHLELAHGCAANGIVRVFRTMLEPQETEPWCLHHITSGSANDAACIQHRPMAEPDSWVVVVRNERAWLEEKGYGDATHELAHPEIGTQFVIIEVDAGVGMAQFGFNRRWFVLIDQVA